ncbi:hypothetical protein [Streptomyces sparsus]
MVASHAEAFARITDERLVEIMPGLSGIDMRTETATLFASGSRDLADAHAAHPEARTFRYVFTWRSPALSGALAHRLQHRERLEVVRHREGVALSDAVAEDPVRGVEALCLAQPDTPEPANAAMCGWRSTARGQGTRVSCPASSNVKKRGTRPPGAWQ